jgi:hypothetical protein
MATLRDINRKIGHAEGHLDDLQARIEKWAATQPVEIVHQHDTKTGWHTLRVQNVPEPPEEWVDILGDFAADLRSSLEWVVEALVLANNGTPNTKNKFPIVFEVKDAHLVKVALRGVADAPAALIDTLQPYHRPHRPQPEPLEVLADLANVDKHHHPHAVTVWTKRFLEGLAHSGDSGKSVLAFRPLEDCTIIETGIPGANRLIDETPLIGIRVNPPTAKVEMQLEIPVDIDITFSNGGVVPFDQIRSLVIEVRTIFDGLRPFMGKSQPVTP